MIVFNTEQSRDIEVSPKNSGDVRVKFYYVKNNSNQVVYVQFFSESESHISIGDVPQRTFVLRPFESIDHNKHNIYHDIFKKGLRIGLSDRPRTFYHLNNYLDWDLEVQYEAI